MKMITDGVDINEPLTPEQLDAIRNLIVKSTEDEAMPTTRASLREYNLLHAAMVSTFGGNDYKATYRYIVYRNYGK
jgi:hypothetical protein